MVRRIFVDANVIFEHALKRKHWRECMEVFRMAETGQIECYASSASFFTLSYFIRKEKAPKEILRNYLTLIHPLPTNSGMLETALTSDFKDVEDGFQYFTALRETELFLTFNIKDFEKYALPELPCLTPVSFLEQIVD